MVQSTFRRNPAQNLTNDVTRDIHCRFGVSTPLVFVGSYFGYKKEAYKPPVRVNLIPRPIPSQPWYMHPMLTVLFGGILPFGAVSVITCIPCPRTVHSNLTLMPF